MSRIPRVSIRKGPKVKPQQETETSFNESGSSAVSGAHAAPPEFVASGTSPGIRGSGGHGSLVTSPVSPPLSLSEEVLSPVCTDGASEASLTKAQRKKLAEAAERKKEEEKKREADRKKEARKAEKREKEKVEAERKMRQEAEKKAEKEKKRKEEKDKKSKGKKPDAKSLQDERSPYNEDLRHSSTLVSSQHAAITQRTATPGAGVGHSQEASGGRNELAMKSKHESEKAAGVNVHGSPSFALEPYESEPRSVLSSSYDEGQFGERQSYENTIDDLTKNLEKEKEVSKKARDDLERELSRKDDELRALQWKKEHELEEALQERDRTTREGLQKKEKELKQREEELQVAMQTKTEKWRDLLREQMEMKQGEVNEKQKEIERLQARLREKESAATSIVSKQEGEVQKLQTELELKNKEHEIALKKQRSQLQALMLQKERDRKKSESDGKEAVQTRESALQKVREELKQKTEEFEAEKEAQQSLRQASIENEQQVQEIHSQLEKQNQEHAREMESTVAEQQVLIRKMKTDHQTELEKLHQHKDQALQEALQQRGRETSERVAELKAAQDRLAQELKGKDAQIRQLEAESQRRERELLDKVRKDRGLQEAVQQRTRESSGKIAELETQHAKELERKDARIRQLEAERQRREREISDKDRVLQERVQQRGGESAGKIAEMKTQHAQELKRKDAKIQQLEAERQRRERELLDKGRKDRGAQETVQQRTRESAGKIAELETQHAKELKEKDAKIRQLEAEGQKRHREVMDESKKEQELQIKIQEMEKQHREELEEKNRQVQRAIDEMHKSQKDALKMQKARIERKVEKEQERKLQETLDRAKTELEQAATDKAKTELQQKETEFQAVFAKSKEELQQKEMEFQAAMQRRDREFEDRMVELRSRHVQELVGKDAKIYQLQEEAAQFIPSSEPPDEAPSSAQAQAREHPRISVHSQQAHMDDLPSNVIDLAREISHFVDPEDIIPQGKLTREISPDEFHHVMQAFGSPAMLGAQKPQSFLFAVLPANNKMRSTLFDYTGCFGEIEEEQPGSLPYRTPDGGSPEPSMPDSLHGSSFQEVQSMSELAYLSVHEAPRSLGESGCYLPPSSQRHGQMEATLGKPQERNSATAGNLPDSVKIERLRKTVEAYQRLQADKEQQLRDRTNQVEELSEAAARREQNIVDLEQQIEDLSKKVRDLSTNVDDQSRKVEERDRQIDVLRKGGKVSAINQKTEEDLDDYFEQVVKLTEQVTQHEAEAKKQEREMNRLKELEGRIEEFEKQVFEAGRQLSEKEEEMKSKDDEIRRLQHDHHGGEQIQALEDEIDKLRPLETEITKLRHDLRKAQQAQAEQLPSENEQLKLLRAECAQLKTDLEAAERDVVLLNAEVARRDAQQSRIEAEEMQKEHHTVVKELDQARGKVVRRGRPDTDDPRRQIKLLQDKVKGLEEKLESRDEDIKQLREEHYPSARFDPATLEGLQSGSKDSEVAQLREVLEQREKKIHNLEQQVRSFEGIIKDRHLLQGHSKEQSRAVFKLQKQLEATASEKRVLEEVQYGELEVVTQLEQARAELKRVTEERDSARVDLQQAQQDLTATEQESKKELQRVKNADKLLLEGERDTTVQLRLEIQGWETDVKRLETELNLQKAEKEADDAVRVVQAVDTEEGISALQGALSDAEHKRQDLHGKYIQQKQSRERAERECIELRVANEELGIKLSDVELEVDGLRRQASSWKEIMQGQGSSVATLKDKMEKLVRENQEFKEENEIRRQEIEFAKRDFEAERHDREQAAKHYDEEKAKMNYENQQLSGQLRDCLRDIDLYRGEIDQLKGQLAHKIGLGENFEAIQIELVTLRDQADAHKAQQTAMKKELEESHQKLEENIANSAKLHDDVLVKTQQMKQYKKQVDGYKAQMGELKAEMDVLKAELGVYQERTMQQRQQLAGAQQMAADKEALQRERDTLAAQLQMLKGRKSSESEFATAFQKEFDKRDEFEKQNEMLKGYCDRLLQENNKLMEVLKHNNIPCPAPLPQPHPPAADVLRAGGPVVPRSPSDQQRALGYPTPQQTPTHPSRFDPRHHQPQYQPQHDYPPQQQHLQQERQRTVLPREQGRVQQTPAPQQPLNEAAVFHQQAHVEAQGLVQQQELGGQREAQERALQQQLEQQAVDQREAQARALYQQQLEQQTVAEREAQARAIRQQQLEQQAVDQRERALHQQQAVAQREAQERVLRQQQLEQQALVQREAQERALHQQQLEQQAVAQKERALHQQQLEQQKLAQDRERQQPIEHQLQTQAHVQKEAVQQAHERRVLQQQQIEQQQHDIYRKQKGSQGPLKPQMKAYSVDDPRHAYGQPQVVPQPHPHEGSHVPRNTQERLLPNRPQLPPATLRSNAGVQNISPPNYRMPQQQGYPPPISEYDPHRQPSSMPSSISSMRHTADHALRMQEGGALPTSTRAEQPVHRPYSGFVRSSSGHQQGIVTNADANQLREHDPIPRANIPQPSQQPSQPPQVRNPQQLNVANPRNTPVSQTPGVSQAPHGRVRDIQGTVVPLQATNAGVAVAERVSAPTQETNPNLPQQRAGIKQSAQDPQRSLDKDALMMKDLQGDIRNVAANVEAITTRGGGVPSEGGAIPLDPNLVCPLCNKIFRIGEIQTFRRHVDSCTGT